MRRFTDPSSSATVVLVRRARWRRRGSARTAWAPTASVRTGWARTASVPTDWGPNGLGPNGLGPNGLGPNGLGPERPGAQRARSNGLDVNGLGPNGLGPNGLGPNGLIYAHSAPGREDRAVRPSAPGSRPTRPARRSTCGTSSAAPTTPPRESPTSTSRARPGSGPASTASRWSRSRARPGSRSNPNIPTGAEVRARMTVDEGRWVSSCLLAHVNLQGTHQYISLRGSPPNPEAAAALQPGVNEEWIMGQARFGAFFADLFPAAPPRGEPAPVLKYACTQGNVASTEMRKADVTVGRNCDVENCKYRDASGAVQAVLTDHLGSCWLEDRPPRIWLSQYLHWQWAPSTQMWKDPFLDYDRIGVTYAPVVDGLTLPPSCTRSSSTAPPWSRRQMWPGPLQVRP